MSSASGQSKSRSMTALTVHTLGVRVAVEVEPGATVASLKDHLVLAQGVPNFHELRLFYNGQELQDGSPIPSELQVVITLSPADIVAKIVELNPIISESTFTVKEKQFISGSTFTGNFFRVITSMQYTEAVERLGELEDLAPALCQDIMDHLIRFQNVVNLGWSQGLSWCEAEEGLSWYGNLLHAAVVLDRLARSFGRACGNAMPYIREFIDLFRVDDSTLGALAEIALRDAEQLRENSAIICDKAMCIVRSCAQVDFSVRATYVKAEAACQLLGELGGCACKLFLQILASREGRGVFPPAALALERIATREKKGAAHNARS